MSKLAHICEKNTSLLEYAQSNHAYITSSHMCSHGNDKQCAETVQFRLCKHGVNKSEHVFVNDEAFVHANFYEFPSSSSYLTAMFSIAIYVHLSSF